MKTRKGYKVHPLTSAQKLRFYCLKYCPKRQMLNIGPNLTIQVDLDWNALKSCIQGIIVRYDIICLRFTHDKEGNIYQYAVREEIEEVEHFDFTSRKEEDAEQKLRGWTEVLFERYDSSMHHIVMVKMPDGYRGLYICVNHMTIDAQSLILLFRDVIGLYTSRFYSEVEHPKGTSSYIKQPEGDLAYEARSRACEKDRQFFQELIASSKPIFTDIYGPKKLLEERKTTRNPKLRAATNTSDNVETNITDLHLEGEPPRCSLSFCEKHGIPMTCLLLMDLRTCLQKENDQGDVSVITTISRRTILSEERCGGNRIHRFPFRATVLREDTPMESPLRIRDAQNQYFRHAGYSPSEYFNYRRDYYKPKDGRTYEPLSLTYQPLVMKCGGPGPNKLGDIEYRIVRYSNGVAAHTLYSTVSHKAESNGLDFGFKYRTGAMTPEKLGYIHYYLCRIIPQDVEDPERPAREVIEMA